MKQFGINALVVAALFYGERLQHKNGNADPAVTVASSEAVQRFLQTKPIDRQSEILDKAQALIGE
jgi:hypothetical protein